MERRVQPEKVGGPIKLGYRLCWGAWRSVSAETAWKPAVRGSGGAWEKQEVGEAEAEAQVKDCSGRGACVGQHEENQPETGHGTEAMGQEVWKGNPAEGARRWGGGQREEAMNRIHE